jgi:hypothetical protein
MIPFAIELGALEEGLCGKNFLSRILAGCVELVEQGSRVAPLLAYSVTPVIFGLTAEVLGEQLKNASEHPTTEVLQQRAVLQSSHSPVA